MCRGPDFGKLASGESVRAASGQLVTPDMCMGDAIPGEVVAVVDCPDDTYLPALAAAAPQMQQLANDEQHSRVKVMVHLTSEALASTRTYRDFARQLPQWQHVYVGCKFDAQDHAPSLPSSHRLQVHCRGMQFL